MLHVAEAPAPDALRGHVSSAMADYRLWRGDVRPGEEFQAPIPLITEALERWIIPQGSRLATSPLDEVLLHGGRWHLQISLEERPRYYARAFYEEPRWEVEWFGESWLAKAIDEGLDWLDERADDLDGEIRVVSTRLFKFSGFWLFPANQHLVVSASDHGNPFLPTFELLSQERLRLLLLDHFGPNHGQAGIIE